MPAQYTMWRIFQDMKENPEGEFEIEGNRYSKMEMRIVDTGYGL